MIDHNSLANGLWRNPYMKVYSLIGEERVMEVSTYPRAYKDTMPHIYLVDTSFIVTLAECNVIVNGVPMFWNEYSDERWGLGETAWHRAGEPLAGDFPLWVESESLPNPVYDNKLHQFPVLVEVLLGEMIDLNIIEADLFKGGSWLPIDQSIIDTVWSQLSFGTIKIPRKGGEVQRIIARIKYTQHFRMK